ncbi:MAG: hypothetical protein AAF525_03190 [Pseudomonadota bacterium]
MNAKTFRRMLSAYGAHSENWPVDMREEAEAFLNEHPEAQRWALSERSLDLALTSIEQSAGTHSPTSTELAQLRENILNQIPTGSKRPAPLQPVESWIDQIVDWLWPQNLGVGPLLRSATAAGLPIVIGAVLGATMMTPAPVSAAAEADEEGEEIYLIALVDDTYAGLAHDEMENSL